MADTIAQPEASAAPLTQTQRLIDTFVAPSKTFTDVRRSASWWLPWLIGVVVTLIFGLAIQQKIGWEKTYDNILRQSPSQQQKIDQLAPDAQARAKGVGVSLTRFSFWATPVGALLFAAIAAGVLLATVNFGFGGRAKFGQMFAVWMYGTLPWAIQGILAIIAIYAGVDPDSFNLKNPVGTNIGYFLPTDISRPILALASALDIFTIWALILLTIGCSIIGNVKKGKAAGAVFGWWILITLIKIGAAAFS